MWNWKRIESLDAPSPRVGHSFTRIPNSNDFLLFGGANHEEGFLDDLYLFNSDNLCWKLLHPTNRNLKKPSSRYEHVACILERDGQTCLFIWGGSGENGLLDDSWLFDLEKLEWRMLQVPNAPLKRTCQQGYVVSDRKLYIYGGGAANDIPVDDKEVHYFDFDDLKWGIAARKSDAAPKLRLGHSLNISKNQKYLYVAGGMNATETLGELWRFCVESGEWTLLDSGNWACRSGHASALFGNSKLLVYGGVTRSPVPSALDDSFVFDCETCECVRESITGATPLETPSKRLCMSLAPCSSIKNTLYSCISQDNFKPKTITLDEKLDLTLESIDKGFLMFGGMDLSGMYNDLFYLSIE